MTQRRIPAVYMRGGTSRCLVFHERTCRRPAAERDAHPARRARQPRPERPAARRARRRHLVPLQGLIIGPPTHPGADVDYTFAQVEVRKPEVDYTGNCGNCSSAVGPFAIDEGLVAARDGETVVRIHNTNTKKLIVAHVPVRGGEAAVAGDFELPGVAGRGARIALDFVDPGGAGTGRLLPTGRPATPWRASRPRWSTRPTPWSSCAPATSASPAPSRPQAMDGDAALGARLEAIRVAAAQLMGIPGSAATPKIAVVTAPAAFTALDGAATRRPAADVVARAHLDGQLPPRLPAHRGDVPRRGGAHRGHRRARVLAGEPARGRAARPSVRRPAPRRGGDPAGRRPHAERVTVYRTARRLMEGLVRIP